MKTPKIFNNKTVNEISEKNITNEFERKENFQETPKFSVNTKDGTTSSDEDTLTKGSRININLSTSERIFTFPSRKVAKSPRSKPVTKENTRPQERTKTLTSNFEKQIEENSNKLKISKSFTQTESSSRTNECKTFRENTVSKPKSFSINHSLSLTHKKHRILPQIPEKNLREKEHGSNVKLSLVEQQIQKFKESEQLLYNSVSRSILAKPKPVPFSSIRSELTSSFKNATHHSRKSDSIPRPKYVVKVDVGKSCDKGKNFKALQNYMSLLQDSRHCPYNQKKEVSSQSTADLNVYNNIYVDKDYSNSKNIIPHQSFKNNKKNFLLYRSKTPNFPNTYFAQNDYFSRCRTPVFQQPHRNFSSSLGFPIEAEKMKKRHVTSIYVDSNDSPFSYSQKNHYFSKHKMNYN